MNNIFGRLLTAIQTKRGRELERMRGEVLKELNITNEQIRNKEVLIQEDKFTLGDDKEVVELRVYRLVAHRESTIQAKIQFDERVILPSKNK